MQILPAVKPASDAADFAATLFSGTKNASDASKLKNTPAFSDLKREPAFSNLKNTPAFSELKNTPNSPNTTNAAALSDVKNAAALANAKNAAAISSAKNAAALANAKNIPASSAAKNSPTFADVLRQAQENVQGANSSAGRNVPQTISDRTTSFMRTPETPAGNTNSRNTAQQQQATQGKQQQLPLETQQQHLPLENPQDSPLESRQYTPLEKAPTTPHTTNGVHYQLGEINFTQQELAKLRDKLLQEGLSPQSLTAIEQLASHPHGATLGQLLALMNANLLQKVSLSDTDKVTLQHFADKIDPGGTLGKNVTQLLENGQNKDAWDAIKSSLASLDPRQTLTFEAADAAVLCKAFGVSQATSLEILQNFGNFSEMPLTPEFFTALMLPAQEEILSKVQQDSKLSQALAKHLQPIINEARLRTEKERQAAEGADRKSKHAEILIRDKFMAGFHKDVAAPEKDEEHAPLLGKKDAFGKRNDAADRKNEAGHNPPPIGRKNETDRRSEARAQQAEAQTQQPEEQPMRAAAPDKHNATPDRPEAQHGKTEASDIAETPPAPEKTPAAQDSAKAVLTAKSSEETPAPPQTASGQELVSRTATDEGRQNPQRPHGEQNQGRNNEHNQDTRRDSPQETLLSRIEVRQPAQAHDTNAFSFAMPAQAQEQGAGQTANPAPVIRQALQQVEQGVLNKLTNGGQRIELQLAPSELGAVTLILTSGKSGEISATIRSEKSETAELVARHLDIIRVNLEEQGLKVDKLEVRHEMLNNQNDWQGMEQHNAMREDQERRDHLDRLRRLGRQGTNETFEARDAQALAHTTAISEPGLHLVA